MKKSIISATIVGILGVLLYFGYATIEKRHKAAVKSARELEQKNCLQELEKMKAKIGKLQEELLLYRDALISKEKLVAAFGKEDPYLSEGKAILPFDEINRLVMNFFSYLDKQAYIKAYQLDGGTLKLFEQTLSDLTAILPIINGETRDIITLMRNFAHFYRVLGKNSVGLMKDVLYHESEIMESVAANFFVWLTTPKSEQSLEQNTTQLDMLYNYAAFFLNTLAGRNYLHRRDSTIRILVVYYCVRLVDKANDAGLNSHGIDIRPSIDISLFDIMNQKGFLYKQEYVSGLLELRKKYGMKDL